jgi:hypothetical protein
MKSLSQIPKARSFLIFSAATGWTPKDDSAPDILLALLFRSL